MDEQRPTSKRLWQPRISLLTTLLLMTILGMGIVVARFWREVGLLRAENKRLKEERGMLVVGDPNQLHAVEIPARFAGEERQSFRVYVPPGQTYIAFVQVNNVPKAGIPAKLYEPVGFAGSSQGQSHARLGPGEHVVTIKTTRRGGRADIVLVVGVAGREDPRDAPAGTSKDRWPTTTPETYTVFGGSVGAATVAAEGAEPLVLLRQRVLGVVLSNDSFGYITPEPSYPLDGVLLWVERAPK